jgi:hypothetical protein
MLNILAAAAEPGVSSHLAVQLLALTQHMVGVHLQNTLNMCCGSAAAGLQSSRIGLRDRLRSVCLLRAGELELSALRSVSWGVLGGERERDLERPLQQSRYTHNSHTSISKWVTGTQCNVLSHTTGQHKSQHHLPLHSGMRSV